DNKKNEIRGGRQIKDHSCFVSFSVTVATSLRDLCSLFSSFSFRFATFSCFLIAFCNRQLKTAATMRSGASRRMKYFTEVIGSLAMKTMSWAARSLRSS
ncbi:hypothetical protein PFISCL1PPCAC_5072, partial [Pristionchus fissidentatus]